MTRTFAYECYADEDVVHFLISTCHLPLDRLHSGSQGNVINALLSKGTAELGLVDEDPGRTHHARRDQMERVKTTQDVELRRAANRHLIIVRPELEECFIRSVARVDMPSELPRDPTHLRELLAIPNPRRHARFRDELAILREQSRARKISTFVTDIEEIVRALL